MFINFASRLSPTFEIYCFMKEHLAHLENDVDGMATYDYIVNNVDTCLADMEDLTDNLKRVDLTGQFCASTARFLCAVNADRFRSAIEPLIEAAIDKDRERRYISSLLEAIWGKDYMKRVDELRASDDNFRRIYKRIYNENFCSLPINDIDDE